MTTELLYQTDSYLHDFTAVVTAVDAAARILILDRTAFYPGGGGQPADTGTLSDATTSYVVSKAQKSGDSIAHVIPGEGILPAVGTEVRGQLDWVRRYALMRTHTALHVLCGVVFRDYGALVTGGNMEPLKARMDFEFDTLQKDFVQQVEVTINQEIAKAREIRVRILPREEAFQIPDLIRTKINLLPEGIQQVRTVEIVGLDLQADGGTHVHNISEVGRIRVVDYMSKGKINKRMYIELDPA